MYPAELCCASGDMSRVDWAEKGLLVEGQEDMVETVLDEVGEQGGKTHMVLVKWKVRWG